jgi:hypothetical protein
VGFSACLSVGVVLACASCVFRAKKQNPLYERVLFVWLAQLLATGERLLLCQFSG